MRFIQRFMYGRYGADQLSFFLLALYLVLYLVSVFLHSSLCYALAMVALVLALYRIISRRPDRRRAENAKFLALAGPAVRWSKLRLTMLRDREHRYFRCPNCGQRLRAPRGKGKITVNCRNCGVSFEEKT